ncbi:MAG: M20/M25/M40 family metallo-hydrolase [Eubacterium sp.]|nr:M20/M25/M40 family metallo-hydrolase [Eubacterium sp.]
MVNTKRLIENFTSMVALDSPSFDERLVCDYIKEYLADLGIKAAEDGAGAIIGGTTGNLHAVVDGDIDAEIIAFSSHMDTVEPSHGKCAVIHDDGTITSKGDTVLGSDDLAGVTAILEALTVIKENGLSHRPIELIFTVAEETHGGGVTAFDYSTIKAKQAYVFDLDGEIGTAASSAPTILTYKAKFIGKSAHAGFASHLGRHAVKAAALAVTRIPCGSVDDGINANVGVINGGKATNIVPDLCTINGEIRSFDDAMSDVKFSEVKEICTAAAEEFGCKVGFEVAKDIRAFCVPDDNPVVKRFKSCCGELGLSGECAPTFGGSDNNVFAQHGIDGIVVSTGMNNCHSVDEYTTVDMLTQAAELALKLMTNCD